MAVINKVVEFNLNDLIGSYGIFGTADSTKAILDSVFYKQEIKKSGAQTLFGCNGEENAVKVKYENYDGKTLTLSVVGIADTIKIENGGVIISSTGWTSTVSDKDANTVEIQFNMTGDVELKSKVDTLDVASMNILKITYEPSTPLMQITTEPKEPGYSIPMNDGSTKTFDEPVLLTTVKMDTLTESNPYRYWVIGAKGFPASALIQYPNGHIGKSEFYVLDFDSDKYKSSEQGLGIKRYDGKYSQFRVSYIDKTKSKPQLERVVNNQGVTSYALRAQLNLVDGKWAIDGNKFNYIKLAVLTGKYDILDSNLTTYYNPLDGTTNTFDKNGNFWIYTGSDKFGDFSFWLSPYQAKQDTTDVVEGPKKVSNTIKMVNANNVLKLSGETNATSDRAVIIYDFAGRRVGTATWKAGQNEFEYDTSWLPYGIYFIYIAGQRKIFVKE